MRVNLSDNHNGHGVTFTLNFIRDTADIKAFTALKKIFKYLAENKDRLSLYSYGVDSGPDIVSLSLAESDRVLARIDYLWNHYREDQKFIVLETSGDPRNNPTGDPLHCPHFSCHICGLETWGVGRDTMEVYDKDTKSIKLVSVHDECKLRRLVEVETSYTEA